MSARDDRNKREAERTHQVLIEARAQERDALIAALVAEYADLLAGRRPWSGPGAHTRDRAAVHRPYLSGGRDALRRVATRLGVPDLHDRAADVVARGEG